MRLSPVLNDFQRFLTRGIYVITVSKLGHDVELLVMAFLTPSDVMK